MEWWQIGEIIEPHTTEEIELRTGELVYLFEPCDPKVFGTEFSSYVQSSTSKSPMEFFRQLDDLEKEPEKKVAIITQQRQFVVLARDSVREIDADMFEEKVLQHMPATYEKIEEMEKVTMLMKFFNRCSNCYVDRYFSHLVNYTRTILENLKNCSFEVLEQRRKWIGALLESVRVFIHDRKCFCQALQEQLIVFLHQEPLRSDLRALISSRQRDISYKLLMSPQAHASFHEILGILNDCLTEDSLFYFDLDHFYALWNLFESDEFRKDLGPLKDNLAFVLWYRTRVDIGLKEALERFYKNFRDEDLVTRDTFVAFYTGTRSEICFDSFLQAINGASKDRCEVYVRAFTRYIYIEPALFVAYLNGLPEIVSGFEYWFDRIMKEKGIQKTWKEAIDCPRIERYLTHHYSYRNIATKSFYYYEKTFASLTFRTFDKSQFDDVDGLFGKLLALAPPTDFEAYDNIDHDARACFAYGFFNEDSSPLLYENNYKWNVYLSNGAVIKLPVHILKTWRTDDEVLKSTFVLLMKRETTYLGYLMSHLIQRSEDHARLFLEVLLHSKENCPQVWHTGVGWFVLFYCLQWCDGLKTLCGSEEYIGKLVTLFCDTMKSSLSCGTLYVYFHKLKSLRLNEDQIEHIEKKFTERRQVDDYFKKFANGLTAYEMDETFFYYTNTKNYSYTFFAAFSNRLLRIIQNGDGNTLESDVKAFRDCIHKSEELRRTFCRGWFKEQLSGLLVDEKNISYFPAMDHLKKLFGMTWAEYHAKEIVGKTIVNLYDKDSMTIIKTLGEGGFGRAVLVRIKDLATEVVAKEFFDVNHATMTSICGELEILIKMQSHPHMVHIYGYLVNGNGHYEGIIMEYCSGGDLYTVIKKRPKIKITKKKVLSWARQAACGLMFLHKHRIIHRDVKPVNMFVNSDQTILKIGDFGLIKFLPELVEKKSFKESMQRLLGRTRKTVDTMSVPCERGEQADAVLMSKDAGTEGFIAPEFDNRSFYTATVDVFSLGRSIWFMIFGRNYSGYSHQLTEKVMQTTLGELSDSETDKGTMPSFEPSLQLKLLILEMMLREPSSRPEMEAVYKTLSDFIYP